MRIQWHQAQSEWYIPLRGISNQQGQADYGLQAAPCPLLLLRPECYWVTSKRATCALPTAPLAPQLQSRVVGTEIEWPAKPQLFPPWPMAETVCWALVGRASNVIFMEGHSTRASGTPLPSHVPVNRRFWKLLPLLIRSYGPICQVPSRI